MDKQQIKLQENTCNKDQKIANLNQLIRELDLITTIKKKAFLELVESLRQYPNEDSYIQLKNLLESIQPVLCAIASKVAVFENDNFATNNPEMPVLSTIKNQSVNQLQESTKLQIQQIDEKGIQCSYQTFNRELAKQMLKINESVDFCIGHLFDKFESYQTEPTQMQSFMPEK